MFAHSFTVCQKAHRAPGVYPDCRDGSLSLRTRPPYKSSGLGFRVRALLSPNAPFVVALLCCVLSPAWAQDSTPEPSLCVVDSPVCRKLAIEVAKLELTDFIQRELDSLRSGSFLCPEDNPNCCPPRLMPLCSQVQRDHVVDAQRQFHSVLAGRFGDCPWSAEMCDSLGSFYCGAEAGWTPWGGCSPGLELPPRPPLPPPLPCPCGTTPNLKGLCIPKVCTGPSGRVPCNFLCSDDLVAISDPPAPESNLERHMRDQKVQIEAAKRLREDLKAALEEAEAQIKELSQYR